MSDARSGILQRLRSQAVAQDLPSPPVYEPKHGWSQQERIAHFIEKMESVHGEIHRVTQSNLAWTVEELLVRKQVKRLLTSEAVSEIAAINTEQFELVRYSNPVESWKPELFSSIDASITTTRGGIAETGSLILWPDAREPRLMSLVPPIHIALLHADRIHETFAAAIEQEEWASGMPTNALLISGPSKTADIEQTLAYGIHGPKQLVVMIIEE